MARYLRCGSKVVSTTKSGIVVENPYPTRCDPTRWVLVRWDDGIYSFSLRSELCRPSDLYRCPCCKNMTSFRSPILSSPEGPGCSYCYEYTCPVCDYTHYVPTHMKQPFQ